MPLRKGRAQSKRSLSEEGLDLYIRNTRFAESDRAPSFLLFSSELRRLESAVVCVRGWHSEKAALAAMKSGADMLRYVESNVLKKVDKWFEFESWRESGRNVVSNAFSWRSGFSDSRSVSSPHRIGIERKEGDGIYRSNRCCSTLSIASIHAMSIPNRTYFSW